jgi:disulfide bond formation protein DsbB
MTALSFSGLREPPYPLAAAAIVFLVGLATILGAWGFEIIGGYTPCALCLKERIPYYVGLPVALFAAVNAAMGGPAWLTRGALLVAFAIFAIGGGLGVYHAGAEWKFWPGPASCGAPGALPPTLGDIFSQPLARPASCTEPNWRFLGLSFAGWNAVVSFGLAAVALFGALVRPQPRPAH